ncbi:uncharacterized protein LOC113778843 isoform X2 [Coffea eugenioides]|uniref:uncharacterized protein LOC113778843 isoform X2 n=1 Tax=Coffea eugenioides TaxID=49369 RepID=UPI000F614A9F|nr:uncharacterized protein LOC113778843 isoform X2 [Coffea eugenioides]
MLSTLKIQPKTTPPRVYPRCNAGGFSNHRRFNLPLNRNRRFVSVSLEQAEPSDSSSHLTSTVGSSSSLSPVQWTLSSRHLSILSYTACAAFKRAAESLEKLMDVTREELPDTMAAVRLSGMEISDLTMELSDIGQEITQGVKSSTRAVRVAGERLRQLTNLSPSVPVQVVAPMEAKDKVPVLARTARGIRIGIVKGRGFFQMIFTLTHFYRIVLNFFKARAKA